MTMAIPDVGHFGSSLVDSMCSQPVMGSSFLLEQEMQLHTQCCMMQQQKNRHAVNNTYYRQRLSLDKTTYFHTRHRDYNQWVQYLSYMYINWVIMKWN